jgi:GntR family transcriptional regulator, rspAB operon transcriptional repressor
MADGDENQRLVRVSVFNRLRAEILSCTLRPGTLVQERDLADRFKVSKSPIRDALLRLEEQSLVEVLPRRGYRVKAISVTDAKELYEMRAILERECVIRTVEEADDVVVAELDQFRDVPANIDLNNWVDYNRRFHVALAKSCGNQRLMRCTRDVIEQFDRFTIISVINDESNDLLAYVNEHDQLIDAIQGRDKRLAVSLIKSHIESSRRRMLDSLTYAAVVQ